MLISVLIPLLLLTGCVTARSSGGGFTVVQYTKEQQSTVADEIEGNACPVMSGVFMPDYSVLRDQASID